ncbi:MAG: hypothetical protein IJM56_03280, partial [Clostridia bacterium]|nr:hypothetical protein [Clostridia bacterium]
FYVVLSVLSAVLSKNVILPAYEPKPESPVIPRKNGGKLCNDWVFGGMKRTENALCGTMGNSTFKNSKSGRVQALVGSNPTASANKNPVISRLHAYVTGFSFLPNFIAHDFCIPAITVATQLLLTHFAVEIT